MLRVESCEMLPAESLLRKTYVRSMLISQSQRAALVILWMMGAVTCLFRLMSIRFLWVRRVVAIYIQLQYN